MKFSGMLIITCIVLSSCLKMGGSPALLYAPLCSIHQSKSLTQKQMFCSKPQRMRNSQCSFLSPSCGDRGEGRGASPGGPAGELGCGPGKGGDKRLSPRLPATNVRLWEKLGTSEPLPLVTKTRGAAPTSRGGSEKHMCEDGSGH